MPKGGKDQDTRYKQGGAGDDRKPTAHLLPPAELVIRQPLAGFYQVHPGEACAGGRAWILIRVGMSRTVSRSGSRTWDPGRGSHGVAAASSISLVRASRSAR